MLHAGIYYPTGSLKAKLCVEANPILYKICEENKIPYKKLGKIIVGNGEEEIKQLTDLMKKGEANGVGDLELIDSDGIKKLEPKVRGDMAKDKHLIVPCAPFMQGEYGLSDMFFGAPVQLGRKGINHRIQTRCR